MGTMRIEEEPPIDDKIQAMETFVAFVSAIDFKSFGALHSIVLDDINNELICSNVQTQAGQMYDELQRLVETFQHNINNLTLNFKRKKIMHS